ncbi:MAG: hypothetical protein PHN33_04390 [Candidatus Peribacteraceae bacterium]|nr:hypothetical protein [Candidatus Peribacteraceae bacterium]
MATAGKSLFIGDVEGNIEQFDGQMTDQYVAIDRFMRTARYEFPSGLFGYLREPVEIPISHRNILSALGYTCAALLSTSYCFEMVTGSDRILHTLEGEFRAMLQRIVENRSRSARVIVVNGHAGKFQQLAEEYPKALKVVPATSKRPVSHFFTSDFATARDEAVHPPLTDDMDSNVLSAEYFPNCCARVKVLRMLFAAEWKQVTGESEPEPPRRRWWSFGK